MKQFHVKKNGRLIAIFTNLKDAIRCSIKGDKIYEVVDALKEVDYENR